MILADCSTPIFLACTITTSLLPLQATMQRVVVAAMDMANLRTLTQARRLASLTRYSCSPTEPATADPQNSPDHCATQWQHLVETRQLVCWNLRVVLLMSVDITPARAP